MPLMSYKTNGERLATVESHCQNLTDICMENRTRQKEIEGIVHSTREDVSYMKGKFDEILQKSSNNIIEENKGKIVAGFGACVAGFGFILENWGLI